MDFLEKDKELGSKFIENRLKIFLNTYVWTNLGPMIVRIVPFMMEQKTMILSANSLGSLGRGMD